jgi:hypothetical protein
MLNLLSKIIFVIHNVYCSFPLDLGNLSSILSSVDMQILFNYSQQIQAAMLWRPTSANEEALSSAANERLAFSRLSFEILPAKP